MSSRIIKQEGGATRPKIFSEWPKNPIRFTPSLSKQVYRSDKKQSIRAQQALQKSHMLLINITNLLDQKKKVQTQYRTLIQTSQNQKRELEQLSTEKGQPFNAQVYELNLKNYYEHIRKSHRYYRETEAFTLANLENYDSRVTSVKLTRTHDQAQKQLYQKLTDLKTKRHRLQESLIGYQQNLQQSKILSSSLTFQPTLQSLNRSLSPESLQQVHYLMLYQLNQITQSNREFYINLENDHESYAIYEAIHDSMGLMVGQREEMRADRKKMEAAFGDLGVGGAGGIVTAARDSLPILLRNEKVYDANVELLARYNAETNLAEYSTRRKQYSKQLQKYKSKLSTFKKQQEIASYLYSRHQAMNRYTKRVDLGENNPNLKAQRQDIKHAYYDCLNCLVPEEFGSIRRYRMDLVRDLGGTLEKSGILMPERNQLLKASQGLQSSALLHREENKFHKYLNFFVQLQKIPNPQKSSYLLTQKQTIQALNYELDQSTSSSSTVNNYKIDLDYCEAIVQHQQTNQGKLYLDRVEKYSNVRWTSLPIGLDSLLFYYTNDVLVKGDAQAYVYGEFQGLMQGVQKDVEDKIKADGVEGFQSVQAEYAKEYPYEALNRLTPQQRRQFFFNYLRKLSQYSPQSKRHLFQLYFSTAQQHLLAPYIRALNLSPQSSKRRIEVTKKHFFTLRVLAYLTMESSKIRLSTYTDLLEYYIGQLDRNCLMKYSQTDLFMEIVKQRVFIRFLKEKIERKYDLGVQGRIMEKVNEACLLLYQANDHLALVNANDIETHMEHSAKIQRSMEELNYQINPTEKIEVQEKCRNFIMSVKKFPLSMGTKAPVSQFDFLINVRNKIDKLKIINKIPPSMMFLSAVYTRCHNLLAIHDSIASKYSASDVVVVTGKNDKTLYLNEVEAYDLKELTLLKPYFYRVMGIYKGKGQDRPEGGLVKSNYKSEMEVVMDEIIGKLEKMSYNR